MIDVGAHFGESCEPFLHLGWKVIGFEPDSDNFNKIKQHRRLSLFGEAISNQDGLKLAFYKSNISSGISSLIKFHESHKKTSKVATKTLDTVIEENGIKDVTFLKIDTEGNDLLVLQGLDFNKIKPEIIICEYENEKTRLLGYDFRNLADILMKNDYTVFVSEWEPLIQYAGTHKWVSINKYPHNVKEDSWGNFIAVMKCCENKFVGILNKYTKRLI